MNSNDFCCSVVVPMYNEEENAPLLIERIDEALQEYSYELILVDDCSTDNTRQVIKRMQHPKVMLVELKKNYGQSSALMAGIDAAEGDYVITMDGDLQNDPKDIPEMLRVQQDGDWDVVTGIRQKRKDNFLRKLFSKVANRIIRKTTGLNIKDHGCALKVFTKETAKELDIYGEFHRFITLIAFINGARVTQMKVKHHPRKFGKSKYGFERTFKVLNDLILLLFQRKYLQKPIYLFGNFGFFLFGIGAFINLYLLVVKLLGQDIANRPLLLLGILLVLAGIQIFTIGIVLDLQMRTYYESQNKRPFNIRKITRFGTDSRKNNLAKNA